MSTERDELAALLKAERWKRFSFIDEDGNHDGGVAEQSNASVADAILAAGYRKPQQVTTLEELDALPFETVIRDAEGHVLERWGQPKENLWATVMVSAYIPRVDVALPATVLHVGGAE